mmetsp:Transcript_32195/g.75712  ORF Transcript_32195/g.75712 Transcript_32195/m.75712 type:complete len:216 (-) Transcript_32195:223-870(-)
MFAMSLWLQKVNMTLLGQQLRFRWFSPLNQNTTLRSQETRLLQRNRSFHLPVTIHPFHSAIQLKLADHTRNLSPVPSAFRRVNKTTLDQLKVQTWSPDRMDLLLLTPIHQNRVDRQLSLQQTTILPMEVCKENRCLLSSLDLQTEKTKSSEMQYHRKPSTLSLSKIQCWTSPQQWRHLLLAAQSLQQWPRRALYFWKVQKRGSKTPSPVAVKPPW